MKFALMLASFAVASLSGCGNASAPEPVNEAAAPTAALMCGKDMDCKGDRICDQGACVAPTNAVLPAAGVGDALERVASETTTANEESTPIPICTANDTRTKVPVWHPETDGKDGWLGDPPTNDGQIVHIRLTGNSEMFNCQAEELQTASVFYTPGNAMDGGLAVNLRGNTHFANGTCFIDGFFMNEQVQGMHQGWVETYFEAVPKQQIVVSGRYCLDTGS